MSVVKGSPLTEEEFAALQEERTAELVEAYQRPRDPVAEAALSAKFRKLREFDWDTRVIEFESEQEAMGTRMALSNFVFEIVTTISTIFMPGCYGLIVNDGSKAAENMIQTIVEHNQTLVEAEKAGIPSNPVPRVRKS